jgi:hypothetical protein
MNNIRRLALLIWVCVLEGILPPPALAIQSHGPPEGFYLHLIAHLVFIGALIFFIYKLAQAVREHPSFRLVEPGLPRCPLERPVYWPSRLYGSRGGSFPVPDYVRLASMDLLPRQFGSLYSNLSWLSLLSRVESLGDRT